MNLLISSKHSSIGKALIEIGIQKGVTVSDNIAVLGNDTINAVYIGQMPSCNQRSARCADISKEELVSQADFLEACKSLRVNKLIFLAPASIYPNISQVPISEKNFLIGKPHDNDSMFSVIKMAGVKLCEAYNIEHNTKFIPVIHSNIYGILDDFDTRDSHVIPSMIHDMVRAKQSDFPAISLMGSGLSSREFLYSTDFAEALYCILDNYESTELINVGSGTDISIKSLSYLIKEVIQYKGKIIFNMKMGSDGRARQLLNCSKIRRLGWNPLMPLKNGIKNLASIYEREFVNG